MDTQTVKPTVSILDAATGLQIDREMTDEEFAQFTIDAANQAKLAADKELQKKAKADLLVKLGITADEAALLLS
jgi:hypothetical protein